MALEWRDSGALLAVRKYGETAAIIDAFTSDHGRHRGIVLGGASRRMAPILQPGAQLDLVWRARLNEHLGNFKIELRRSRAASILSDRLALGAFVSVCALVVFSLPEREPHRNLYELTVNLLDSICRRKEWMQEYVRWELKLLEEMGFGLDLEKCAVSGTRNDLIYISPRSGRAVSRAAAGEWARYLLPYASCLKGRDAHGLHDILRGLNTTGYFLERRLAPHLGGKPVPEARNRFVDQIAKKLKEDSI